MLDIIGNIKIDESKPERVDYFIACLKSWEFFKEHCKVILNIEGASDELLRKVKRTFEECKFDGYVSSVNSSKYGKVYCELIAMGENEFIHNFIEDHFALIDDAETMSRILNTMKELNVDVLKTSFFQIEQNSRNTVKGATTMEHGKIFRMNAENHIEYGRHYGSRYFLGVNFLTTRDFAIKFWNRDIGHRPHEYEIDVYKPEWEHTCMIPSMEIQCAVDDDHGEPNTCLLKRNEEKFERIYNIGGYPLSEKQREAILQKPEPNETLIASEEKQSDKFEGRKITVKERDTIAFCVADPKFVFNDLLSENIEYLNPINVRWADVILSGTYLLGKQSEELEARFAKFIGKKYCITVKNCTDALMMTVRYILRERPDATVILPNFGAYPTAIAVKNCTDNIYFVDVDESLTIDVTKLPDVKPVGNSSNGLKNGIIIPVHLFGNHANMKAIRRYADANGHIIIEDCAQSTGSGSGQVGEFSCFSFYPTKPLGTMGDGGAICTNDKTAYEELLKMRNYGLASPSPSRTSGGGSGIEIPLAEVLEASIIHAGINSRMGELECAVVNAKLDSFEQFFEKRRAIASRYKKIIAGIRINSNCIYHQFPVLFNEREKIIAELRAREIPFMIHYPQHISELPVFQNPPLEGEGREGAKVGFRVNDKIISLPCHPFMQEEHIQKVEEFLTEYKSYEY